MEIQDEKPEGITIIKKDSMWQLKFMPGIVCYENSVTDLVYLSSLGRSAFKVSEGTHVFLRQVRIL